MYLLINNLAKDVMILFGSFEIEPSGRCFLKARPTSDCETMYYAFLHIILYSQISKVKHQIIEKWNLFFSSFD